MRLFAAATLSMLLGANACTPTTEPGDGAAPGARATAANGAVRELFDELQSAVAAAPDSAQANGRLAMAYDVNELSVAAAQAYRRAADLAPDQFAWPYLHALVAARTGAYESAMELLDRALAIDPDYAPAWLWHGTWAIELGELERAGSSFARALDLGAASHGGVGLARVQLRQGEAGAALEALETVPLDHPYVHRLRARALRDLGRDAEARIAYASAAQDLVWSWRDPRAEATRQFVRGFAARLLLAQEHMRQGDAEAAFTLMRELRRERPDDPALASAIAVALLDDGQIDNAISALERALTDHPDYDYFFHGLLASAHLRRGAPQAALEHVQRTVELSPAESSRRVQLGMLMLQSGQLDVALEAFDTALADGVREPHSIEFAAGLVEVQRERLAAGLARFERAAALDPTFARAHIEIALVAAELGNFERARAALAAASELGVDIAGAKADIAALENAAPESQ